MTVSPVIGLLVVGERVAAALLLAKAAARSLAVTCCASDIAARARSMLL